VGAGEVRFEADRLAACGGGLVEIPQAFNADFRGGEND
jgi:hypothetical protein